MDENEVLAMGERFSNWGRWGADDEVGTLNHITPEKVRDAAALVRQGKSFGLAIPFDSQGPQTGGRRFNPIHLMVADGASAAAGAQDSRFPNSRFRYADDVITMPLQCATQWDAYSHVFYDNQMYNGHDSRLVTNNGAAKNGIEKLRDKIVSRGVLLDIPRFKKTEWMEPGYAVTIDDLDGCAASQGVAVGTGDIVLVRTGHQTMCRKRGSWEGYAGGAAPGLSLMTASWLYGKEIAAVATDTWGAEVRPNEAEAYQPLHMVVIRNMGLLVGEIFFLDELAEDCARDGVYDFLFVGPPLPITGAVGSPINPMAIK